MPYLFPSLFSKTHQVFLVSVLLLLLSQNTYANYLMGSDLFYRCLGANQYEVTLILYQDCGETPPSASQSVDWIGSCGAGAMTVNRLSITDITPTCTSQLSPCQGGTGNYGVNQHVYTGILNLSPLCTNITLSWEDCCISYAITTLSGANTSYIESNLDNSLVPCNSSPIFQNPPIAFGCRATDVVYNHATMDPDGDSLSYSLVDCEASNGVSVNYTGSLSGTNPIASTTTVTIDPNSGQISFNSNSIKTAVICVLVEEYRNGVLVGSNIRNMQFWIRNCNNDPPVASGDSCSNPIIPTNFIVSTGYGSPLCFDICMNDPNNGDSISAAWIDTIAGATFSSVPGLDSITGTFCWTPMAGDVGTHSFTVTVTDDACPLNGSNSYVYTVIVLPTPSPPLLGSNGPVCDGDTLLVFNNSTCDSMIWTGPSGIPIHTTLDTIMIPPGHPDYQSGTWSVVCVDLSSGIASNPAILVTTVNPPIGAIGIINNGPVCNNGSLTFTATTVAGASYTWLSSDSTTILGSGNPITLSNITSNTLVYAIVNLNGCEAVGLDLGMVYPVTNIPSIPANFSVCEGAPINLSTNYSGASSYSWTHPGGYSAVTQNALISSAQLSDSGPYTLSTIDNNGCVVGDTSVWVTVNPLPTAPTLVSNSPICTGDTLFITSSGPCDSTIWIGPSGLPIVTSGNVLSIGVGHADYQSGSWTVQCKNAVGCVSTASSVVVTVNPPIGAIGIINNSPVCNNGSLTFTATTVAGASYTWLSSDSTTILGSGNPITLSNITSNTLVYAIVNLNGCEAVGLDLGTVYPVTNIPSILANFSVCEGAPINLSTNYSGASSYSWTHPGGYSAVTQNALISSAQLSDSGPYTLSTIDNNGCVVGDTSVWVTVNPLPTAPTLVSNSPICTGDTLFITSSGPCDSTIWIGPSGLPIVTSGNVLSIGVGHADYQSGSWTVQCKNAVGCVSTASSVVVAIKTALPSLSILNNSPVCIGSNVMFFASMIAGATYTWYGSDSITILGTGNNPSMPVNSNLVVHLVVDYNGCSSTTNDTALVFPMAQTPNAPADFAICEGEDINLVSTTNDGLNYQWNNFATGFSVNGQTGSLASATVADSGIYTLTMIDSNGCAAPDTTVRVTINAEPLPPLLSNSSSTLCDGDTLVLSVVGACDSVVWMALNGQVRIGDSHVITPSDTSYMSGNWTVICIDTFTGCSSPAVNHAVLIDPPISTVSASNNGPLCIGANVTLTASFVFGVNYTWYSNATLSDTIGTDRTITVGGVSSDSTFYLMLSTASGCQSNPIPTTVTVLPAIAAPAIPGSMILCENELIVLTTPTSAASYNWTGPNGFSSSAQNPGSIIAALADSGTYRLSIVDSNGCQSLDTSLYVTVNSLPTVPTISNTGPVCSIGDSITLNASFVSGVSYEWHVLPTGNSIGAGQNLTLTNLTYADTGSYYVVVMNNAGCMDISTMTTFVSIGGEQPIANADHFTVLADGNTETILVSYNDVLTTNWDIYIHTAPNLGQLLNLNNGQFEYTLAPSDTVNQSFVYELCNPICPTNCDTALVTLTVLSAMSSGACQIPNIFTPNGDGINDYFEVSCLGEFQHADLLVFNRWGDLVFETTNYQNDWNGVHDGGDLPSGTYFYIIKIENGEITQGSIEIKR